MIYFKAYIYFFQVINILSYGLVLVSVNYNNCDSITIIVLI